MDLGHYDAVVALTQGELERFVRVAFLDTMGGSQGLPVEFEASFALPVPGAAGPATRFARIDMPLVFINPIRERPWSAFGETRTDGSDPNGGYVSDSRARARPRAGLHLCLAPSKIA
jgi:hypothetical protein